MKILIVESDTNKQRQLRTILTSLGHKSADIESVSDNRSALSALRKKRYDCAFLELVSGGVDGMGLLKDIRTSGSSRSLPVVIYGGDITKENVIAAHEAGASGFLAYPFSVSDVENVILRAIAKK